MKGRPPVALATAAIALVGGTLVGCYGTAAPQPARAAAPDAVISVASVGSLLPASSTRAVASDAGPVSGAVYPRNVSKGGRS
jgi:hypothetical protein